MMPLRTLIALCGFGRRETLGLFSGGIPILTRAGLHRRPMRSVAFAVSAPLGGNCSFFDDRRDQFEVWFSHIVQPLDRAIVRKLVFLRTVSNGVPALPLSAPPTDRCAAHRNRLRTA